MPVPAAAAAREAAEAAAAETRSEHVVGSVRHPATDDGACVCNVKRSDGVQLSAPTKATIAGRLISR